MSLNAVSSATLSSILQNTVSRIQSQLTTSEIENSTGKLADIGLTLGADSGQDIALHQQMADLTAISNSNAVVTAQLGGAANALTSLQSTASTMLSAFVDGASGTANSIGAAGLQQQASGALQTFASLMNSDVGGVYVFGGINSGVAPIAAYSQTPPSMAQNAVETAFQNYFGFAISSSNVNSITGTQMQTFLTNQFAALFSGSNWTSDWSSASDTAATNRIGANQTVTTSVSGNDPAFQNMAEALTMVSAFGGLNLSSDAYSTLMSTAQSVMNSANNGLISASTAVGTMENQVTEANSAINLQQNVLTTQINAAETVNAYDVATQVSNLSTQLQTAYSLTSQIHKLSLVNFL
ncbi:flagellar hook-associated family protein [Rhodoblastus acidophilus]|uniref:Flagellin n=1 Tax=Candidatus Rhodoblastus alkanivorans TaxID=2954117 RepID=A0ABS9Z3M2_9HYPH|nr:flagellar hook-associated family protein [Candidatus Rhodoblastus alkanivorans]MCI4678793.1 flagellar hook-associated family protein [Candidatus Rhodoblastus alkanivorans]MCI4682182.1 flagellar hook-associated family protein [Candidatus Rhodoblastus alkanivorans]MDI4639484.1 flagellar hook-associated family protein [Rhodoblastus acidophilus]